MTVEQLIGNLKKKIYHPVYFLHGEEPYYIDKLSDYIEENILSDSEKEFNQTIVYGKDVDMLTLISYARRYPMMSSHQVVIVKEAQDMKTLFHKNKDEKDPFAEYLAKPTDSTLLVFCYKYNKLDKRTKISKLLEKQAVVFESKRVYERELPAFIATVAKENKLKIGPKATQLLSDNLGADLTRINNQITKLAVNVKDGEITPELIEEHIGVSKDFNIFELQQALGKRDAYKAFSIADYFASNPKSNPMVLTITQLHSWFMKVLTYHKLENRSPNHAASALGISSYFVPQFETAARSYSIPTCIRNIGFIRDYDLRYKGVDAPPMSEGDLLKELLYKILH